MYLILFQCQKLEECDYESLVVIISKKNEYSHITGSRGGRDFLEDKQPFISDFRKYCSGKHSKDPKIIKLFHAQLN